MMNLIKKINFFLTKKNPNICIISTNSIIKINIETNLNCNFVSNYKEANIFIIHGYFTLLQKEKINKILNKKKHIKLIVYKQSNLNLKNYKIINNVSELKDFICN